MLAESRPWHWFLWTSIELHMLRIWPFRFFLGQEFLYSSSWSHKNVMLISDTREKYHLWFSKDRFTCSKRFTRYTFIFHLVFPMWNNICHINDTKLSDAIWCKISGEGRAKHILQGTPTTSILVQRSVSPHPLLTEKGNGEKGWERMWQMLV